MPKKKNFLGGQQNYNPNNGQYEPALKGPNGESPSQFSSFKKQDSKNESFDAINAKRMGGEKAHKQSDKNAEIFNDYKEEYTQAYKEGGEKGLKDAVLKSGYTTDQYNYALEQLKGGSSEEPKGSTQYFKHPEVDGVWHDTGKTIEKGGNSYKVYENEQGKTWAVSDRFSKQFQPFDKDKKTELLSKDYLDKFYELSGGDEDKMLDLIRKDPTYQNNDADPNDTWSMGDLEGIVGAYFEKRSSQNKNNDEDALKMLKWGGNFTDDEWEKVKANETWVKGYLEGKYTPKEIKAALKAENETNSFEETNAKRMGKEMPKVEQEDDFVPRKTQWNPEWARYGLTKYDIENSDKYYNETKGGKLIPHEETIKDLKEEIDMDLYNSPEMLEKEFQGEGHIGARFLTEDERQQVRNYFNQKFKPIETKKFEEVKDAKVRKAATEIDSLLANKQRSLYKDGWAEINVKEVKDGNQKGYKIEFNAEMDYDEMAKLHEQFDEILKKNKLDGYFEHETSGRSYAYIYK